MNAPSGRLLLIGYGKMGSALLEGWLKAGVNPQSIVVSSPTASPERASALAKAGVALNPDPATIGPLELAVLAVKPDQIDLAMQQNADLLARCPLIVSIATGRTLDSLARQCKPGTGLVRAMPNTPASIGRGVTAFITNTHVTPAQKLRVHSLLAAVGEVVELADEGQMDAVTAVSGSGPAYVFFLTEAMTAAGIAQGLEPDIAASLARGTVAGAGALMMQSGLDAATLRENVTSPKGTTAAALAVLSGTDGLEALMGRAVEAAAARARALSK